MMVSQPTIPKSEWKWFGNAGHYICAQWCRFHLCTQVGPYLISTVGAYVHPRHGMGSEQREADWVKANWPGEDIGLQRKYETMVFRAGALCIVEGCNCGIPCLDPATELDMDGYNQADEATAGHMKMCEIWAARA
jgi:hypothetical protein